MNKWRNVFSSGQPFTRGLSWIDLFVMMMIVVVLVSLVEVVVYAPQAYHGPKVHLSVVMLPVYTFFSLLRMFIAYILSIVFTLIYGRAAAYSKIGPKILIPILDILQSVPILSFLPLVMLSFGAILPQPVALEIASVVLIFTSQVWNLTFSWYQSLTTLPRDLQDSSAVFGFSPWMRFFHLELSFAALGLVWNSILSWAGGWFFLMAAEMFTVGDKDFRLPGLGSFLREAAIQNDTTALFWGIFSLVALIVILDQLIWRPLLAWAEKFKLTMMESQEPMESWFLQVLQNSKIVRILRGIVRKCIKILKEIFFSSTFVSERRFISEDTQPTSLFIKTVAFILFIAIPVGFGFYKGVILISNVQFHEWFAIIVSLVFTLGRVFCSLILALLWTLPLGILIGTNRKLAAWLQPIVQIAASVPATALFPVILVFVLDLPHGTDVAAIILMMMGTQWYLLFNIIAGASAIPEDLKYTSSLMQLSRWQKFRRLTAPALAPYVITGAILASGGAWNASVVAEYFEFGGQTLHAKGIGALISQATAQGNYPLLLTATLAMILCVVTINRLVWRRCYNYSEERFRLD